jgi:hypothetical protein
MSEGEQNHLQQLAHHYYMVAADLEMQARAMLHTAERLSSTADRYSEDGARLADKQPTPRPSQGESDI